MTAGTVSTLDDRRVEPPKTFTVTLLANAFIEVAEGTAEGCIEDDNTEQARKRCLGTVLAGMGPHAGDGHGGRDRRLLRATPDHDAGHGERLSVVPGPRPAARALAAGCEGRVWGGVGAEGGSRLAAGRAGMAPSGT